MLLAVLVGLTGSVWVTMTLAYTYGGVNLHEWYYVGAPRWPFTYLASVLASSNGLRFSLLPVDGLSKAEQPPLPPPPPLHTQPPSAHRSLSSRTRYAGLYASHRDWVDRIAEQMGCPVACSPGGQRPGNARGSTSPLPLCVDLAQEATVSRLWYRRQGRGEGGLTCW